MSNRRAQDERIEGTPDGASAISEIMDVPDVPTIGTATNVGTSRGYNNGAATVAFTANATGGTVTTYTATSNPGSLTGTAASSPVTVSGLASQTSYTFTVTGGNTTGTSAATAASNSITATTVPQAPTIGTVTRTNNTTVSVPFTDGATGGSAISSYTVTSSPSISLSTSGSSTPLTVTGTFIANQAYTFTMTATNANGTSTASSASNSVTPLVPPPAGFALVASPTGTTANPGPIDVWLSTSGTSWTQASGPVTVPNPSLYPGGKPVPNRLRYGNGKFFAALSYSPIAIYSTDDGNTWSQVDTGVTGDWQGHAYYNSTYIATNGSSNFGMTSSNATTWTQRTSYPSGSYTQFLSLASVGYIFAPQPNSNVYHYTNSPTSSSWASSSLPSSSYWREAISDKSSLYVALSSGIGNALVATTTSIESAWTLRALPTPSTDFPFRGVFGSAAGFVVSHLTSNKVLKSTTGTSAWSAVTMPFSDNVLEVAYGNGTYVAVPSAATTYVATSTDATTWTQRTVTTGSARTWQTIGYKTDGGY